MTDVLLILANQIPSFLSNQEFLVCGHHQDGSLRVSSGYVQGIVPILVGVYRDAEVPDPVYDDPSLDTGFLTDPAGEDECVQALDRNSECRDVFGNAVAEHFHR